MIGGVVYVEPFKLSRSSIPGSQVSYDVTGLSVERFNEIVNCDKPIVCKEIAVTDPDGLNLIVKNISVFTFESGDSYKGILVGVESTTLLIMLIGDSLVAILLV